MCARSLWARAQQRLGLAKSALSHLTLTLPGTGKTRAAKTRVHLCTYLTKRRRGKETEGEEEERERLEVTTPGYADSLDTYLNRTYTLKRA